MVTLFFFISFAYKMPGHDKELNILYTVIIENVIQQTEHISVICEKVSES